MTWLTWMIIVFLISFPFWFARWIEKCFYTWCIDGHCEGEEYMLNKRKFFAVSAIPSGAKARAWKWTKDEGSLSDYIEALDIGIGEELKSIPSERDYLLEAFHEAGVWLEGEKRVSISINQANALITAQAIAKDQYIQNMAMAPPRGRGRPANSAAAPRLFAELSRDQRSRLQMIQVLRHERIHGWPRKHVRWSFETKIKRMKPW